jgi:parvulin-like peptidyl-prolyl isomerase
MIKRLSALILSLTLAMCAFSGCADSSDSSSAADSTADSESSAEVATVESSTDDSESETETPDPSLTIDGESIDTTDFIVCTVDGTDIDFDTFRFYYYYTLSTYTSTYGVTIDDIADTDNGFETLLSDVILNIKQELVSKRLAEDNGIELDDDDEASVETQITTAKSNYDTEEAYIADLKASYLTEDLYKKMLESAALYTKVSDTLFSNDGKYATKRADFREIVQDTSEYCREIHVMIPFYSQAELDESTADGYDDMTLSEKASAKSSAYYALDDDGQEACKEAAEKVAEEVLKKANDGEDFESLIAEYGWDSGLEDPTNGYYFNKDTEGGYPEELVTAAFALDENEVSSELVLNDTYGYFIIKRLPVDMDYVEENIDAMISSYDSASTEQVYTDTMEAMEVTYCDQWDKLTADSIT